MAQADFPSPLGIQAPASRDPSAMKEVRSNPQTDRGSQRQVADFGVPEDTFTGPSAAGENPVQPDGRQKYRPDDEIKIINTF